MKSAHREPDGSAVVLSGRIYRHLLVVYPREHRHEYGPAMAQLFRDQCRDAWRCGCWWGLTGLWLRVLPDLMKTSVLEHISTLRGGKSMMERISAVLSPPSTPRRAFVAVFAAVFLLVVTTSTLITFVLPESYSSTARIRVERDQSDIAGLTNQPAVTPYDPFFIRTEVEALRSETILGKVIEDLDLRKEWGARYARGGTLTFSEALTLLKGRIDPKSVPNTSLIEIRVFSEDPEETARLANAIAQTYRDYRLKKHAEIVSAGIKQLEQTYEENIQKLEGIRAEITKLSNEPGSQNGDRLNEARGRLELLQRVGEALSNRIAIEKTYQGSSITSTVEIVDPARPQYRAVRPNKPLNICAGIFVGCAAGLLLAALAYALRCRAFRRASGAAQTPTV